jgi:hypothetical protein
VRRCGGAGPHRGAAPRRIAVTPGDGAPAVEKAADESGE